MIILFTIGMKVVYDVKHATENVHYKCDHNDHNDAF